jgi:hypothetical protein
MMVSFRHWLKLAKDNPKVSAGVVVAIVILYTLIF